MRCPNDGAVLETSERDGVEVDSCPDCRGVWLDRGELDKILDRSNRDAAAFAFPHRTRRKRSFLSDLFDD